MKRFKIKLNFIRYFTFIPLVISEEKIRSYRNLRRFAMYRGHYRRTRMYRYLTNFLDRETWKRIVERKIKILEEIIFIRRNFIDLLYFTIDDKNLANDIKLLIYLLCLFSIMNTIR